MSNSVDPVDGSPPGFPVPGILQARTLEWVAISFSNAGKWKVKGKSLSRVQLLATPWTAAYQAPPSMGFSRQEYWSGVPSPSPYNGLLFGNKGDFFKCIYNIDGPWKHYASGRSQTQKARIIWSHLCERSRIGKSNEIETQGLESGTMEREMRSNC